MTVAVIRNTRRLQPDRVGRDPGAAGQPGSLPQRDDETLAPKYTMVATPRIQPDPPDSKPGRLLFRNYLTVPYHEEIALREKTAYLELLRTAKIKEIEAAEARATKRAERRRERLRAEVPVGGATTAVRAKLELAPLLATDGQVLFSQDEEGYVNLPSLRVPPASEKTPFRRRLPRNSQEREEQVRRHVHCIAEQVQTCWIRSFAMTASTLVSCTCSFDCFAASVLAATCDQATNGELGAVRLERPQLWDRRARHCQHGTKNEAAAWPPAADYP